MSVCVCISIHLSISFMPIYLSLPFLSRSLYISFCSSVLLIRFVSFCLSLFVYIYIYIYVCVCACIFFGGGAFLCPNIGFLLSLPDLLTLKFFSFFQLCSY